MALLAAMFVTLGVRGQAPLVPDRFPLSDAATRVIDAAWLTDEERAALRVFHGVWDDRDLASAETRAIVAMNAWRFDDPALADPSVPLEIRAEARLTAGELEDAITLAGQSTSIRARRIAAEAFATKGDYDAALEAIKPVVDQLLRRRLDDAGELTDGVRALVLRARIEGQPARDYQTMMTLLGRAHQELDRLYWPALLLEAKLLLDKSNRREGVGALHETLRLNPRSAEAWYELGRVALTGFDFDSTGRAEDALRRIDPLHPLEALLHAESRLTQNDPEEAQLILSDLVARWPRLRPAHALAAAASALLFDHAAAAESLARYEELSPGSGEAYYTAGRFLSMFRQYDAAAEMLEEAIRRQPGWAAPQLELGRMEMQTGRDQKALAVIRDAMELDPFDKRVANSLFLLEELAEYDEIETEHFVIRYRPGVDEVLVSLMPEALERIHETVEGRFGWEPSRKTTIEVMPDHHRFAVRITGMPHVHTIAACTGPIIAMEVPRDGPSGDHQGVFDWQRVLQHEYTHTITLEQTRYRIPHWLTEAAAVSMELAPRDYDDCVMLARAHREGSLFDLDEIKWAFVRPRRAGDRGKAYAQGHWMVEYMNEQFGHDALVTLLGRYFEGEREAVAIPNALGVSREAFFEGFLAWAGEQVKAWGLAPEPSLETLMDEVRMNDPELAVKMVASRQARLDAIVKVTTDRIGQPRRPGDRPFTADRWPDLMRPPVEITDERLAEWRRRFPDHPDLLKESIRRRLEGGADPTSLVADLERLVTLRPVDVYPHRKLAQIYLGRGEPGRAAPHLEAIDAREQKTPVYARQLATAYRAAGEPERALAKITRAVNIDPYHASNRELAAAIAVEASRLDLARLHVKALTLLEPDRPRHQRRLERLDELLRERS
ncbi:MAG: tetratricopeptide repeat protein [Phycisphaerales bacterium]|nr:tetratricopeptide repeat protein [Phycisphaerales bacterium]